MNKRFLEDCLGKGMSLPQIGKLADKDPSTVGYWVKKYGLAANGAKRLAQRGGIDWEVLEIMVEDRLTLTEMGEELDRSISTVRYWLREYGLEPTGGSRRQEGRQAKESGLRHAELECRHHGRTLHVLENRGTYRCVKCRSRNVAKRRPLLCATCHAEVEAGDTELPIK